MRFLARLYPASWRQRYGVEFAALLEDISPDWRASLDITKGALEMQIRSWNFGKILAITGVTGALLALGLSFAIPRQYVSTAVLKVDPPPSPVTAAAATAKTNEYVLGLTQRVASRTALTATINRFDLYRAERARMPIEDVIESMKRNISIVPIRPAASGDGAGMAFAIRFVSGDAATAQKVTEDLAGRFIGQNVRYAAEAGPMTLRLLDPANLPRNPAFPKRPLITTLGLAAGLAVGIMLAGLRRSRKPAES